MKSANAATCGSRSMGRGVTSCSNSRPKTLRLGSNTTKMPGSSGSVSVPRRLPQPRPPPVLAVPALIPPRRVIILYQCFSVSQRADARYRHLIALFTQDEYFAMVAENESEQESWYLLLSRLILESKRRRCGTLGAQPDGEPAALAAAAAAEPPFYKDVWQVVVKPRGLGHRKELSGVFRLCLTDEEVVFVRLNTEVASVVVQLLSIRRCGHSEQYFFLEVGRSTVIGPGELWMQVDDSVVAQNMHELFLEKMRALCADEYRARCRSYSISVGAHLLTLLSTRRHLGSLPLEPGGWFRRSRFEQFCHLRAICHREDMLFTRRFIAPREPPPPFKRGRGHLPRARRSRRAVSVPPSFPRRSAPSPGRIRQPEDARNHRACQASGSSSGNSEEKDKEGEEGNGGACMPMNNWGSGNGRGSGGGQGSSGQGSSSQSSGGRQGSGGGQGSGGQGAGGNQRSGNGQGTAGGHGSGGGGHGSGGGQGPGDGHGSGGGKNSGGSKGSGSGKNSDDGDRGKSVKKRSYFGKFTQSKQQQQQQQTLPPPPPPPPAAGATGGKGKSGGRFRLYFCADRGTKERKEAKEVRNMETSQGTTRGSLRARALYEDEDDPYVPMRPGVAAPLACSSDYMPMAPQNSSAPTKRHSKSPFEDSRGYMMMFPRVSPPPPAPSARKAPDTHKEDDSKDNDSDSDYMFMAPGAGAIPKNPPNPQGGSSSKSWSSYFSLPSPFQSSPLGQSNHSEYVPMLPGKFLGSSLDKHASFSQGTKDVASKPSTEGSFSKPEDKGSSARPSDDVPPMNQAKEPNRLSFIAKGNKIKPRPLNPTQEQREADSSNDYINIDFVKREHLVLAPSAQGLPEFWGVITNARPSAFSRYVKVEFGAPFPNPTVRLSELLRVIPGANPIPLAGARWPFRPFPGNAVGSILEGGEYIEVIFNPALTPAVPFADSAICYDTQTGQIYVVDPFSECCMDASVSPSRYSEPPPVARQEEVQERRRPQSGSQSLFANTRAAVSAFPTDSLDRDFPAASAVIAAPAGAPLLAVSRALAVASALAAAPSTGAVFVGFPVAAGDSASARWFQPVANAPGAQAEREVRDIAAGWNPGTLNQAANGEDLAAGAAAPPPPPRHHRVLRPPERADSEDNYDDEDDDNIYVRMDFARRDYKK
eukprot:XP_235721.7 PREDICTED: insulin receptor substrate 4 isoform X1 [Rattus norvegicus]